MLWCSEQTRLENIAKTKAPVLTKFNSLGKEREEKLTVNELQCKVL